jgi:hypothetical protein
MKAFRDLLDSLIGNILFLPYYGLLNRRYQRGFTTITFSLFAFSQHVGGVGYSRFFELRYFIYGSILVGSGIVVIRLLIYIRFIALLRAFFIGLLLALFPIALLSAQELPRQDMDLRQFIVEWEESEDLMEDLYYLLQQPIDINTASREELERLFFLKPNQINDILLHKQRFGNFVSLYELQVLNSFSVEDILRLQPFVRLHRGRTKSVIQEHYLLYRTDISLEASKGFRDSVFEGGPTRQYLRYKFQKGSNFSLGALLEKDPGEKALWDHQVLSLQWKSVGSIKQIIVGDYRVHWGQGVLMGSGFKLGKGAEPVLGIRRGADGFSVHQSVTEAGGFRGTALHWGRKQWQMGSWASHKRVDANRSGNEFSSLQSSGLHRTATELEGKNAVSESHGGVFFKYAKPQWQLGVSGVFTYFDANFVKQDLPYNYFQFRGQRYAGTSLSTVYYGSNYALFGEFAYANAPAWAVGLALGATKKWELGLHLRHYPEDFHSLYGSAFGENTLPQNERGQYLGIKYTPIRSLVFSGHVDRYRFPWVKYGEKVPKFGSDFAVRASYSPKRDRSIKMVFRSKSLQAWNAKPERLLGGQLTFDRKWLPVFHTQSSVQVKWSQGAGQAWIQDIEGQWRNIQWRGRVAWFSTASYDARIYAYENDVLYASSFPAYYGTGFRFYINLKVGLGKKIDVWLRLAQSRLEDKIGSGWNALEGSRKTDVRGQVRYQF